MDDQSAPEIEADEVEVYIENGIQVEMNNDIRSQFLGLPFFVDWFDSTNKIKLLLETDCGFLKGDQSQMRFSRTNQ